MMVMMFSNSDEVMEWLVNLSLCRPSIMMTCLRVLIGLEGSGAVDDNLVGDVLLL